MYYQIEKQVHAFIENTQYKLGLLIGILSENQEPTYIKQ